MEGGSGTLDGWSKGYGIDTGPPDIVGLFDCSLCVTEDVNEGCEGSEGIDVEADAPSKGIVYSPGGSMRLCGLGLGGGEGAEEVRDVPELYGRYGEPPKVELCVCEPADVLKILDGRSSDECLD